MDVWQKCVIGTVLDNGKIVEIPRKSSPEPGSGLVKISDKPPESGSELSPWTIINLNDIDGNDEILCQAPDLSSYGSHSTNNDIEISTGMLYNKISSCLLSALIEDYIKTDHDEEKHERIQGLESY